MECTIILLKILIFKIFDFLFRVGTVFDPSSEDINDFEKKAKQEEINEIMNFDFLEDF